MTHIKISAGSTTLGTGPGFVSVVVDGVEISNRILAEGFSVDLGDPYGIGGVIVPPTVTMKVVADRLDVDMPDAVLRAVSVRENV